MGQYTSFKSSQFTFIPLVQLSCKRILGQVEQSYVNSIFRQIFKFYLTKQSVFLFKSRFGEHLLHTLSISHIKVRTHLNSFWFGPIHFIQVFTIYFYSTPVHYSFCHAQLKPQVGYKILCLMHGICQWPHFNDAKIPKVPGHVLNKQRKVHTEIEQVGLQLL